jgi:hypothetical protein
LLRNPGLKRTLKATKFQKNIQTRRVTSKMEQSPMGHDPSTTTSRTGVVRMAAAESSGATMALAMGREKEGRRSGSSGFDE